MRTGKENTQYALGQPKSTYILSILLFWGTIGSGENSPELVRVVIFVFAFFGGMRVYYLLAWKGQIMI